MALTSIQKQEAYQFFIIAFGAPTGVEYMNQLNDAYNAGMTTKQIVNVYTTKPQFEAQYPRFESNEQFAAKLIENVVGASATAEAKAQAVADVIGSLNAGWSKGDVVYQIFTNLAAKDKADPEWGATAQMLENKVAVAAYVTEELGVNTTDLAKLAALVANVTADVASVEAAKAAAVGANGETLMLTKGLDNIPGTAGNDTIIGSVDGFNVELNTFSALDIINGGGGTDTLKISTEGDAIKVGANVQSVEVVEVSSVNELIVDTAGSTDVQTLKVMAANGEIEAKAAATTDVSVALKSTGAVAIDGGKNVTVALTGASDAAALEEAGDYRAIDIDGAAGDVSVSVVGANLTAQAGEVALGAIYVTGGKTITVEQRAGDASALNTVGEGATYLGDVNVSADKTTTTITVKQDVQSGQDFVEAVEGVKAVQTVKFKAMAEGDSIQVDGLTFTAVKALTAAQAAAAFTQFIALDATQGAGAYTNGIYEGAFNSASAWTAQANGDTVTFTQQDAADFDGDGTLLHAVFTTVAEVASDLTVKLVTEGVTAVEGQLAEQYIRAGDVVVGVEAALTTVNVDGYDDLEIGDGATAEEAAKLATINVANGDDVTVYQAAAELTVNASNIDDLEIYGATKTLNLNLSDADVDLDAANSITALNIAGAGSVNAGTDDLTALQTLKVSGEVDVYVYDSFDTALKSIDTTANTGKVEVAIKGESTTYAGGAGVDEVTVTVTAADTDKITKSIDLGAGDDTLNLQDMTAVQLAKTTVVLEGGEGRDTLALTAAAAAKLSETAAFADKINGFEVLSLDKAEVTAKVDLANLDNINYVVSKNSAGVTTSGVAAYADIIPTQTRPADISFAQQISYALTAGLSKGQSLTIGGITVTALEATTAAEVAQMFAKTATIGAAAKFDAASQEGVLLGGWGVSVDGANIVLTAPEAGVDAAIEIADAPAATGNDEVEASTAAALTLTNIANDGTLELTDSGAGVIVEVKDAATGDADSFNIVTNADYEDNLGTVTVDKVETISINADTSYTDEDGDVSTWSNTLTLDADAAKTIDVSGAGALKLLLGAETLKVVTAIDASTNTGGVTVSLKSAEDVDPVDAAHAVTVTGGAGDDEITAGSNKDIINAGAGDDTIYAGSNGAVLTGGEGNDTFVLSVGATEANAYSSITDFQVGDVLKLQAVTSFGKLAANLNEATAVFSDYVNAAIAQAKADDDGAHDSVWFSLNGNSYVILEQAHEDQGEGFVNGVDSIIQLVGVDLTNASFNSQSGTVALI